MPSIVDPADAVGGAWTATRGLVRLMAEIRPDREFVLVPLTRFSRRRHRVRQVVSTVRSMTGGLPAKIEFARQRTMLDRVLEMTGRERFANIVLNGADLLWLLPYLPRRVPRILVAHNLEHQLYRSQLERIPAWMRPLRALLERDCERLRRFEIDGINACAGVIFLSAADREYISPSIAVGHTVVAPPAFFTAPYRGGGTRVPPAIEAGGLQLLLLANFRWWPNRDALAWFLREVMPRCAGRIHLHLVGPGAGSIADPGTELAASRYRDKITAHGYVEDLERVFRTCHFAIAPLRRGGGVKIKLAEAIYHRIPVIATRFAARGLSLDPDPAIALLDEPSEWVDFLHSRHADDAASRCTSEANARRFSAAAVGDRLRPFLNSVMD